MPDYLVIDAHVHTYKTPDIGMQAMGGAGFLNDTVHVQLPGGEVIVRWEGPGQPVWLTGEGETVFEGIIEV